MDTKSIIPYFFVSVPCVSLEYCIEVWSGNKLLNGDWIENVESKINGNLPNNISKDDIYLPLLINWEKLEKCLCTLSSDRYMSDKAQYSLSFECFPNKLSTNDTIIRKLSSIPQTQMSKFHELSFDKLIALGSIGKSESLISSFVNIEAKVKSSINLMDICPSLKEMLSSTQQNSNDDEFTFRTNTPKIVFDSPKIEKYLQSTFHSYEKVISDTNKFLKTIIVKNNNDKNMYEDSDLNVVYYDIPVAVSLSVFSQKPEKIPIFENLWFVNKSIFSAFNCFLRDYYYYEDADPQKKFAKIFCKKDGISHDIYHNSINKRSIYRGSVDKTGFLYYENLLSDNHISRTCTGQYRQDFRNEIVTIGIGLHSADFDKELLKNVYPYNDYPMYKDTKNLSDKNMNIHCEQILEHFQSKKQDEQSQNSHIMQNGDKNVSIYSPLDSLQHKGQQKIIVPFYFCFVWTKIDGFVREATLIIKDNRKKNLLNLNNPKNSVIIPNHDNKKYGQLAEVFNLLTDCNEDYFYYILKRIVPFIFIDNTHELKFPLDIKYENSTMQMWFSNIESTIDKLSSYGENLNSACQQKKRLRTMFYYNDINDYFLKNYKISSLLFQKQKYKDSPYLSPCFNFDWVISNFGIEKDDIYITYDYNSIETMVSSVISIGFEIARICRIDIQEVFLGSKFLWFTRMCEYLCMLNGYPKPSISNHAANINMHQYENFSKVLIPEKNVGTSLHQGVHSCSSFNQNSFFWNLERLTCQKNSHSFLLQLNKYLIPPRLNKAVDNKSSNSDLEKNGDESLDTIKSHEFEEEKTEYDKMDPWKVIGGDISTAMTGKHHVYDSGNASNISMFDFDAFYNSIICEYKLGYLCINPYANEDKNQFYMSKELYTTFNTLLSDRRTIKEKKQKSDLDVNRGGALKLVGNSFYGCTAARFSPICSLFLSNFITKIGRLIINETRNFSTKTFKCPVLMSHTDSLCIKSEGENTLDIRLFTENVNRLVGKCGHVKLVLEKSFCHVNVINRISYLGKYKDDNNNNAFTILQISNMLDKFLSYCLMQSTLVNASDEGKYCSLLTSYSLIRSWLKNNIFRVFESQFKIKGVVTKSWSLLKKTFVYIILMCKSAQNNIHIENYEGDVLNLKVQSQDRFTSLMLFKMFDIISYLFDSKNVVFFASLFGCKNDELVMLNSTRRMIDKNNPLFTKEKRFHIRETFDVLYDIIDSLLNIGINLDEPWSKREGSYEQHLKNLTNNGYKIEKPEKFDCRNNIVLTKWMQNSQNWFLGPIFFEIVKSLNFRSNSGTLIEYNVSESDNNKFILLHRMELPVLHEFDFVSLVYSLKNLNLSKLQSVNRFNCKKIDNNYVLKLVIFSCELSQILTFQSEIKFMIPQHCLEFEVIGKYIPQIHSDMEIVKKYAKYSNIKLIDYGFYASDFDLFNTDEIMDSIDDEKKMNNALEMIIKNLQNISTARILETKRAVDAYNLIANLLNNAQ